MLCSTKLKLPGSCPIKDTGSRPDLCTQALLFGVTGERLFELLQASSTGFTSLRARSLCFPTMATPSSRQPVLGKRPIPSSSDERRALRRKDYWYCGRRQRQEISQGVLEGKPLLVATRQVNMQADDRVVSEVCVGKRGLNPRQLENLVARFHAVGRMVRPAVA